MLVEERRAGPRTLLVVSGAREAIPVIAGARRMGLRVLVADGAPDAPGFRLADAGLLAATGDADATVEAARAYAARTPIDGVLGVGPGVTRTAAAVAEALGLPGVPPAVATLVSDAPAMRRRLATHGVAVPWAAEAGCEGDVERLAATRDGALVVKPVEGEGMGVMVAPGMDPAWAFALVSGASPSARVMVEEHVAGSRVRTDAVVVRGQARIIAWADVREPRPARSGPFPVELGADLPSSVHPALCERVGAMVAVAAAGLGITHGVITAEAVIGPRGPVLTAFAPRLADGYASTHEIPLATGIDVVEAAILLALGDEPSPEALRPRWCQAVVRRSVLPPAGTVIAVQGALEAAAGDGIALVDVQAAPGQRVAPGTPAGVVIAVGDTLAIAGVRAEAALARIRVITAPALAPAATLH